MTFDTNYRVGIGTTSPVCNLEVNGSTSLSMSTRGYLNSSGNTGSSTSTNSAGVSIKATGGYIWATNAVIVTSDERIKNNVVEINDDLSLKKLRDINCYSYNYIDHIGKGSTKQIGFIAQQVLEHIPEAVSIQKGIVPNEMRVLKDVNWIEDLSGGIKMYTTDLPIVSNIKYRFYVSNDPSGNDAIMKELVGNPDNTFSFDISYNKVFCYGKEVDDFHTLDKSKLFAINFSATQEIDRKQQEDREKIANLESTVEILLARIEALENA